MYTYFLEISKFLKKTKTVRYVLMKAILKTLDIKDSYLFLVYLCTLASWWHSRLRNHPCSCSPMSSTEFSGVAHTYYAGKRYFLLHPLQRKEKFSDSNTFLFVSETLALIKVQCQPKKATANPSGLPLKALFEDSSVNILVSNS